MKYNKILCFILALIIVTTVFAGCKKEDKPANSLSTALGVNEYDNGIKKADYSPEDIKINFTSHNSYLDLGITEEMNSLIKEYFSLYFKALGSFEYLKFESLFCSDSLYEANVVNAMVSYQIGMRNSFEFDMQFPKADVGVSYRSITATEDGGYDIYLAENHSCNFNYISDITSYTSDVEHHFIVKYEDDKPLISSHSEISGVYDLIVAGFEEYINGMNDYDIAEVFDIVQAHFVETTDREMNALFKSREEFNASPDKYATTLTADNEYDAEAALEYSYEWAGKTEAKRNPDFGVYDNFGGNCNNFTSQCLLAGGIPMDIQGAQWKWYGEDVNATGGNYGRSPSWAECDYFYAYCTENEGYGLVCETDSNIYSGKPGDLVQYMADETDAVHTVIITKIIYDDNGNVIDYLINSNTTDMVDTPMCIYGYTNFRLIKIIGWND